MQISIVTVCYNDCNNLKRTINSIRINRTNLHRYYIIDGKSSDGTLDLIKENEDIIDSWFSESDKGLYDAMNKCVRFDISDQDFLLFLNAGDELLPYNPDILFVEKYNVAFLSVIQKLHQFDVGYVVNSDVKYPLNEKTFMPSTQFRHQGFLIKMEIFKYYKYDLRVGQQADGLLMSLCQKNEYCCVFKIPISVFYIDGMSNTLYYDSLCSYWRISEQLDFSIIKILFYQRVYLSKMLLKIILPIRIIRMIMDFKKNRL